MCRVYVHGFTLLGLWGVCLTHILVPQNDWTPISKDEVLRRLSRLNRRNADNSHFDLVKKETDTNLINNITKLTTPNSLNEVNYDDSFMNDAIKLVQPVKTIKLDQLSPFYPVFPGTITSVNALQSSLEENNKQEESPKKIATIFKEFSKLQESNDTNITNYRKPKAIEGNQFTNYINGNEAISIKKLELNQETTEKQSSQEAPQINRKLYQVTEDTVDTLKEEQKTTEEQTGYFYAPPKPNRDISIGNNLTKIFLDILSKHNIRPGDELPNYSLSRRQRNQSPINGYMLIPIPIRAFPQFNNFNLDPLAVLLSNSGYYLPGSYGIRGKYRNLYGYLASNNIHNNKPFGSYKIFSDTDSSN
ncbi:hypothetical protein ABMA27_001765 [Loxostege sticticalis]|uniref:Uncharacterized protein n=1 Tax=Loxostege sticticalis TaxID=481309 RepID=A0ABR3HZQ5_LOXSC